MEHYKEMNNFVMNSFDELDIDCENWNNELDEIKAKILQKV